MMTDVKNGNGDLAAVLARMETLIAKAAPPVVQKFDPQSMDSTFVKVVGVDGTVELVPMSKNFEPQPANKQASVRLFDVRSFAEYINEHKIPGKTRIFASPDKFEVWCFVDYLEAGANGKGSWALHNVELKLMQSEEWRRWKEHNSKILSQEDFCEFLEENALDVVSPDSAQMQEMALTIEATKNARFKSTMKLSDGSRLLNWVEEVNASAGKDGTLKIPERFKLYIPLHLGGDRTEVEAVFRIRISDQGRLGLMYKLLREQEVQHTAMRLMRDTIEHLTELPVYVGEARPNAIPLGAR